MSCAEAAERGSATTWVRVVKDQRMKGGEEVGYITDDMTFLPLSMTRFWTKDLRVSGGKIG